ncbi:MAG: TIGR02281 family clan AA aspartic protease, partial [Comamonadaceae bacterium]
MPRAALALVLLLLAAAAAHGQSVAVQGVLGGKALLVVDGSAPKTVAAGETWKGVKVVSAAGDQAVLEVGGKRQTVRV